MDDNGVQIFWYPDKEAFCDGRVSGDDAWQNANIGYNCLALGVNVEMKGD